MWINGFSAVSKRAAFCQRRILSLGPINSIVGIRNASSTSGLWLPNSNQVKFSTENKKN